MLLTTSPFNVPKFFHDSPTVKYRPVFRRRIMPVDPEEEAPSSRSLAEGPSGRSSTASNLRWPRPVVIPAYLVPRDFDDVGDHEGLALGRKQAQQSAESFFPVVINEEESARFNEELWTSHSYRLRCYGWSLWQKHLKDWWFLVRYPLAYGAALALAISTMIHLARSHP